MTINLRDNVIRSGMGAIKHAAQVWDMNITMPKEYDDWVDKQRKFEEIHLAATEEALGAVLLDSPADEWDKIIEEKAGEEQVKAYLRANYGDIRAAISMRIDRIIRSAITYDHIIGQLPVDEVEADFIDAVHILGGTVGDAEAALDRDADAAGRFRVSGRKLMALPGMLQGAVTYTQFSTFTKFGDLAELTYRKNGRTPEKFYTEEDAEKHHVVANARQVASDRGEYLTELAAGKHKHLSLHVARTFAEAQERDKAAQGAGNTRRVGEAKPTGPRTAML